MKTPSLPCVALCVLVAVASLSALAGQDPPAAPPLAPTTGRVLDALAPASDLAARTDWHAMYDSCPASVARAGARNVLRLVCPFATTAIERASWDFARTLNMNGCRGLEMEFFSRDCSSVSSFSIYFRSGGGWYHGNFFPEFQGKWCTVRVDKRATRTEGTPAGWGQVDLIRVSAWRGQDKDAEFCLADLRLAGADAPIAIVRAEAVATSDPGEARYSADRAEALDRCLGELGLDAVGLSDLGLDDDALAGRKLVILPHNPGLPAPAAAALLKYVQAGGKLMAFYTLSGDLARACGLQSGPHVKQKAEGDFASIRPTDAAPANFPPQTLQKSWNIHAATPIQGKGRVIAQWYDAAGKSTGQPAILASDSCVFMTHVLLDDDHANKQRMLLAMVGLLRPEMVAQAARAQLDRAGAVAHFASFDEARKAILAQAGPASPAATEIARAETALDLARKDLADGRCAQAIDSAAQVRTLTLRAWCLAQKPQAGEHRAFWCHSAFGVQGMDWDQAAATLARNGFTAVIPNMLWGGLAYYESSVLPVSPEVKTRGDQIALCVAACHKAGIACHVWKVNFNCGWNAPKEFVARMEAEGRMQRNPRGEPIKGWLCPSNPANRQLEIDAMVEVARKYDVDGVHFDYIRYPGPDGCFCDGCRERFEKSIGHKIEHWPQDVLAQSRPPKAAAGTPATAKDGAVAREGAAAQGRSLRQAWLDWRREQITAVVAGTAAILRKEKPKVQISAAVFSNYLVDRDGVGQDWKLWCERGYVDFVCPMDYTDRDGQFENLVAQQKAWAGKVPCYPGIGLSCWGDKDVCNVMSKIAITRRLGMGGFTIFNLSPLEANEILPLLGLGMTRKD